MRKMKPIAFPALLLLAAAAAHAQGADETVGDDLTMRLITDASATLPEAVTRQIELPQSAAEATEASTHGLATANAARAGDHPLPGAADQAQDGLDTAAAARDDGRLFGADTAAAARDRADTSTAEAAQAAEQVREDLGRHASRDDLPEVPHPELPSDVTLPDVPAPVGAPGLAN
jgi:hypothetical protein